MEIAEYKQKISDLTFKFLEIQSSYLNEEFHKKQKELTRQYTLDTYNADTYTAYQRILRCASDRGYMDIIDVGSGVQTSKILNPSVDTSNVLYPFIGLSVFNNFIASQLDLEYDINLRPVEITNDWISTDKKYDCALLMRFLPWIKASFTRNTYMNMVKGLSRVLKPGGVVWYIPVDPGVFQYIAGDSYSQWVSADTGGVAVLEITKEKLDLIWNNEQSTSI